MTLLFLLPPPRPCVAGDTPAEHGAVPGVVLPNFWDPQALPEKPGFAAGQALRFLTEGDYPPFAFTLPDGSLAGFNVDLARALCLELEADCTIQARRWDTVVPALNAGSGDAAVASMAITDEALRQVDFTLPYYRTPARFVAPIAAADEPVLPETLGKRRVGVAKGSAHEAYLAAFFAGAEVRTFDSSIALREALRSGQIDLAFGDGIAFAQWLNGPEGAACCRFAGGAFTESRFFGQGAGIAVKKGRGELRAALDYALARLAARGTYADLYLKYFPIGVY